MLRHACEDLQRRGGESLQWTLSMSGMSPGAADCLDADLPAQALSICISMQWRILCKCLSNVSHSLLLMRP